jgi:hypothetical protein
MRVNRPAPCIVRNGQQGSYRQPVPVVGDLANQALRLSLAVPVLWSDLWKQPNTYASVSGYPYYWPLQTPDGRCHYGGRCDMRGCPYAARGPRSYWCNQHQAEVTSAVNSRAMRKLRRAKDADRDPATRLPDDVVAMVTSGGFRVDTEQHAANYCIQARCYTAGGTWSGDYQVTDDDGHDADWWLEKDGLG